jgi:hypothetical protein
VTIALKYPFLLHEIFAFAAQHIASVYATNNTLRQKYHNAANFFYVKSIAQFRIEVQHITKDNCDASFACAVLLGLHPWTIKGECGAKLFFSDDKDVDGGSGVGTAWYKMHRGANQLIGSAAHWIRDGPLWDIIRPFMSLGLLDNTPIRGDEEIYFNALAECWAGNVNDEQELVLERALQALRRVSTVAITRDAEVGKCGVTLAWIILIPKSFYDMIEARVPQALVLIAAYCVLLKRLDEFWWIRGKAESLLSRVRKELPPGWEKWLIWQIREVESVNETQGLIKALAAIEKM